MLITRSVLLLRQKELGFQHVLYKIVAPTDPFPRQVLEPRPPVFVSSSGKDKAHKEWEVLEVVDLQKTKK